MMTMLNDVIWSRMQENSPKVLYFVLSFKCFSKEVEDSLPVFRREAFVQIDIFLGKRYKDVFDLWLRSQISLMAKRF